MSKSKAGKANNPKKSLKERQLEDFKSLSIVIDAWIINASDLTALEKMLLAKITNLIGKQPCYARNQKLMEGITNQETQLKRMLKSLEDKGYIIREVKGWRGQRRRNIYLSEEALQILIEYKKGSIIDSSKAQKEIVKNKDLQKAQNVDFVKNSDLQKAQNVPNPDRAQNVPITIKKNNKNINCKERFFHEVSDYVKFIEHHEKQDHVTEKQTSSEEHLKRLGFNDSQIDEIYNQKKSVVTHRLIVSISKKYGEELKNKKPDIKLMEFRKLVKKIKAE